MDEKNEQVQPEQVAEPIAEVTEQQQQQAVEQPDGAGIVEAS
jgi:hypothetical protein